MVYTNQHVWIDPDDNRPNHKMSFDEGVQATNCDATKCKYSAVKMGYWQDNYIQYFVTGYERKTPEINRGYYARTKGVAMFMDKFLKVNMRQMDILLLLYYIGDGHLSGPTIIMILVILENRIKLSDRKPRRWVWYAVLETER